MMFDYEMIDNGSIDLESEVAFLNGLIANGSPDQEIEEEFDRQAVRYFHFARHELTDQVPWSVRSGIGNWDYYDITQIGYRHGYNLSRRVLSAELPDHYHCHTVIEGWMYFAEMLIAVECGFIPTDPVEIAKIHLERESRKFQEVVRRDRLKVRRDAVAERDEVFGASAETKQFEAGLIAAPKAKGKIAPPRTITVVVLGRRDTRRPLPPRRP